MASNLDYLAPELKPLEDQVTAYLQLEKDLAQAEITATTLTQMPEITPPGFDQRPATGSYPQHLVEAANRLQNLRDDLTHLRQQILQLLPVRDEWIKLNLGYGPSRVGAFRLPGPAADYELRIVI
ncbi:hypothetical protein [Hymenobacter rubripertinctus]|uniref:Uncharacterized protein n=1 Tax=Hymenobacter rubripertinctus TaxID=2029981 RepID=A0A418QX24_9BACT|nr:hypothetical protein [Hymenobacter rubripertinctus]RIY09726.1 hypothetical protein D0T11_11120 [Hymenobacter rubripertinctus]